MRSMVEGCPPSQERDTPPSGLTACHLPCKGRNGMSISRSIALPLLAGEEWGGHLGT